MDFKSYPLLTKQLTSSQLLHLIENAEPTLARHLGSYADSTVVSSITIEQVRILRLNYQAIIAHLNKSHLNINNLSMHLLTTLSLYYRALNMPTEAKEVLKKSVAYIGNPHSDPVLQGVCLNHLASFYKWRGKVWKALKYSLRGVEIVQIHLHEQLTKKEKQEIAILLVVLLIFARNCLAAIMKQNDSKILKHYSEFVNYLGYRSCLKYLGKESVFNLFTPTEKYFHLPVFKIESRKEEKKQSNKEAEIISQLQKIYDVLKSKQNPQFVVINTQTNLESKTVQISQAEQSIFINNQINQVIIQQKPQPTPELQLQIAPEVKKEEKEAPKPVQQQLFKPFAEPEPEISMPKITINEQPVKQQTTHQYVPSQEASQSDQQQDEQSLPPLVMAQETMCLNRWQIKFRLEKEQSQQIGNLYIESSNKKQHHKEMIPEDKLEKILCQINKEDKLSYEIINQQQFDDEFIEHYIKPFLDITDQGKVIINPHSPGLLRPYQIKFLGKDCLVFFNHIRHNLFRAAIAPVYSCKSIYLNVELSQATMVEFFSFQQEAIDFATAIFKSITNAPAASVPVSIKDKTRLCRIVNQEGFLTFISNVITEFQHALLTRQDETAVNEIVQNELVYYKYQEVKKNKLGIYYFIRYLPSINYFDVYLKNNYETYSIDGKIKSRGNALYKAQDFLADFGIPLKASRKNLFAYIEIIAKKYYLLTFEKPLTDADHDRYVQNAILDLPITQNCFRTKLFKRDGYFIPVTISLLTINSETPVGIKVIEYDPITCRNRGFFIHIVAQEWVRPYRKPVVTINNILFQTYINEFPFRSEYFLPEWLEKGGFATLFQKIVDPSSQLCLEHNINGLIRGKVLIKIFNKEDSS